MNRLLILLLAASVSTSALAQHEGHGAAPPPPPVDPHAGHGESAGPSAPQQEPADPHAGHGAQPAPAADPHAGHAAPAPAGSPADPHAGHGADPAPAADPHAGHGTPAPAGPPADPHAGHQMGVTAPGIAAPPVAPPPADALRGPAHAADAVYGDGSMAAARETLRAMHGDQRNSRFTIDRLELGFRNGRNLYAWEDVQFWHGGDIDRLWLKSQGEGSFGEGIESVEVQALWSHAIGPFFDLQAGARYDIRPRPDRPYLVLGVQGLAPYWFEVDAAAFLSSKGDLSARVEAEYDQRITQRLILQPSVELDFSLQNVPELGIGAGLSTAEAGLRLRYEIVPEFAPYVGVEYERAFGDTADFRRLAGEDVGGWTLLLGLRAWF